MFKWEFLIFGLFNLVVLLGGGIYYFRRPLKNYFCLRSKRLQERKLKAFESLIAAETEYSLYFSHLQSINQEMKKLMEDAELGGEREGQKMLIKVENIADRIIEQSMTRADHEVKRRNVKFYRDMTERSISEAEELIKKRITIEKQLALGRTFLKRLCEERAEGV